MSYDYVYIICCDSNVVILRGTCITTQVVSIVTVVVIDDASTKEKQVRTCDILKHVE